jgi:putative membrane protein
MSSEIQAFATGFPTTLIHAGVSLALLLVGCFIHGVLSPYKEVQQVREGNSAAAVSLGGTIAALAIPLAASLNASTSPIEEAIWGGAIVVGQLLLFWIIDLVLSGLPQRTREGEVPAAVLLISAKLAASLIVAAAVAG